MWRTKRWSPTRKSWRKKVVAGPEVVDDSAAPPQPLGSKASDTIKRSATVIAGKIVRLAMSTSAPAYPFSGIGMHQRQVMLQLLDNASLLAHIC